MVQHIATANYSLLALSKLIATKYYGETLRKLITLVTTDWTTSKQTWERNTMLKIAKRGRNLSFRCYISSMGTFLFYLFVNLLKFYRNFHQSERKLVYQFNYPYNIQKSPNYEITFFIQLCGALYMGLVLCSVDSLISILLLHVCAQLINLGKTLNELVEKLAKQFISCSRFRKDLAAIIERHENLIRSAKTIDDCYSTVLFIHMIAATFQLCFETYQIFMLMTDKNANISVFKMTFLVLYATAVLTHLYFYCYSAERLLTESINIAYSVYECKWYNLPAKDAKDLMFMMHRSTIPLRLTAGKFAIFSLEMYGTHHLFEYGSNSSNGDDVH
ncbi:PREDICTED: odorant receptor 63a-like [Dinoponera quadriceps]|uniref:Odorant receptor 63a-like n=1 Tax=Dinoponera quadriceps TaxID=609295 RepID=A0A6P3WX06_DINQU|nr:PREDICTED: odorant receptor 63a-like [Dinoponera quadriceps]